jgi:hypothetical protein
VPDIYVYIYIYIYIFIYIKLVLSKCGKKLRDSLVVSSPDSQSGGTGFDSRQRLTCLGSPSCYPKLTIRSYFQRTVTGKLRPLLGRSIVPILPSCPGFVPHLILITRPHPCSLNLSDLFKFREEKRRKAELMTSKTKAANNMFSLISSLHFVNTRRGHRNFIRIIVVLIYESISFMNGWSHLGTIYLLQTIFLFIYLFIFIQRTNGNYRPITCSTLFSYI